MIEELERDKRLFDRLLKDAAISLSVEEFIKLEQSIIVLLDKYQKAVRVLNRDNNQ